MLILISLLLLTGLQTTPEPDRVVIEPAATELGIDQTQKLEAAVFDKQDRVITDIRVYWFSATPTVASVDSTGLVTAHATGETLITAIAQGIRGYARITVPQLPPVSISVGIPGNFLRAGLSSPLEVVAGNNLGETVTEVPLQFGTLHPHIATVDATGRVFAHQAGRATLMVSTGSISQQFDLEVRPNDLENFEVIYNADGIRTGDVVRFSIEATNADGLMIPDIQPAWMVGGAGSATIQTEGADGVFVAEDPGTYTVTALIGPEISRSAVISVKPRTYDAHLELVGRGAISTHHSGDTWVFEGIDGHDYAYIGTYLHDWMKVWDVTDPTVPILTDSLQLDARRINDVKIHPNNRLGIVTREGASSRRNGIVLLDLTTPAHPTILSEYTETVTGGVHNVWIDGTHELVYTVHNGTRDIHIIDISDPSAPEEVGRWGLESRNKSLHDIIIQEGYAYVSYWDDGLVILDVGAGTHGGTPTQPAFVSRYKYPVGNTHVAWRYGRYVFVGDEIYPETYEVGGPIDARGYIHVLDVRDIDNPVEVARYEVPEAGAHNVWVEDDKLYIGYYQAGLRVVDISGELRGDLYRQGREIAALKTTDARTVVPNWPMAWSAQAFKGNIFMADMNSGLWIAKLIEQARIP